MANESSERTTPTLPSPWSRGGFKESQLEPAWFKESYAGAFLAADEGGAGHYSSNLSDSDVFCHSMTKPEKSSFYGIFCVICFVQSANIALLENRSKAPSAPRHIRSLRGSPRIAAVPSRFSSFAAYRLYPFPHSPVSCTRTCLRASCEHHMKVEAGRWMI